MRATFDRRHIGCHTEHIVLTSDARARAADAETSPNSTLPPGILIRKRRNAIADVQADAINGGGAADDVQSRRVPRRVRRKGVGDPRDIVQAGGLPRSLSATRQRTYVIFLGGEGMAGLMSIF